MIGLHCLGGPGFSSRSVKLILRYLEFYKPQNYVYLLPDYGTHFKCNLKFIYIEGYINSRTRIYKFHESVIYLDKILPQGVFQIFKVTEWCNAILINSNYSGAPNGSFR